MYDCECGKFGVVTLGLDTAPERVMLERIFDDALAFYKDPNNLQAFKAWQKNKEEIKHGTNYVNL